MLTFIVKGDPKPQGSKNAMIRKNSQGKQYVALRESAGKALYNWRDTIKSVAQRANHGNETITGPVMVQLQFFMERPKSHYVANDRLRPLKKNAPVYCASVPDTDKLTRAVLDSLTFAGVYADDSRVCVLSAHKMYVRESQTPHTVISVTAIEEGSDDDIVADQLMRDLQNDSMQLMELSNKLLGLTQGLSSVDSATLRALVLEHLPQGS